MDAHLGGATATSCSSPPQPHAVRRRVAPRPRRRDRGGVERAGRRPRGERLSTSHAEILARGERSRARVLRERGRRLRDPSRASTLIVDATDGRGGRLPLAPSADVAEKARAKGTPGMHAREEEDAESRGAAPAPGGPHPRDVPRSTSAYPPSAEGIGLVRTELVFADRTPARRARRSSSASFARLRRAPRSRRPRRSPLRCRRRQARPLAPSRPRVPRGRGGFELLFHHPNVLGTQLGALVRAATHSDVCILVPYVRSAGDVAEVRARSGGALAVGALIETLEAVADIDAIVAVADFISIGTNDLLVNLTGTGRANSGLTLDPHLLRVIAQVTAVSRARSLPVTVCGEIAGDAHAARILTGLGVTALSLAPARLSRGEALAPGCVDGRLSSHRARRATTPARLHPALTRAPPRGAAEAFALPQMTLPARRDCSMPLSGTIDRLRCPFFLQHYGVAPWKAESSSSTTIKTTATCSR